LGTLALPPSSLHIRTEAVRAIASLVNRSRDAVKNAVLDCAAVPQALARALDSALDDVGAHDLACSAAQLAEQLSGDGRSAHLIRAARLHELLRDAVQRVLAEQHSSPEDTGDAVGLMLACMRALLAIRTTLPSGAWSTRAAHHVAHPFSDG
jgi:hypothetical protein